MRGTAIDTYLIVGGGPVRRLEHRLRVAPDDSRHFARCIGVVVALAYIPILAALILRRVETGAWPLLLQEISVYVRVFVVLPLLLLAESLTDARAADVGRYLVRSGLVRAQRLEAFRSIIARTARLRDSSLAEGALALLAVVGLVAMPVATRDTAIDAWWCLQPVGFLTRFLGLRLLWRWLVWGIYLRRLVHLPIVGRVSHPDRVAGFSPLAGPSVGFALVIMATGSAVAADWGDRMRLEGLVPSTQLGPFLTFAIVACAVATAPLAVLIGPLRRLRWRGVQSMGALASRYSTAFEQRWLVATGPEALGTPDIQSLSDLGAVFERVDRITLVVAPRAVMKALLASIVLPFMPLMVSELGVTGLLRQLAKALL